MVAVAIAAGWFYADRLCRLGDRYLQLSRAHEDAAADAVGRALEPTYWIDRCSYVGPGEKTEAKWFRVRDYHRELAAKYALAARYPWLPVAPDPPEPE